MLVLLTALAVMARDTSVEAKIFNAAISEYKFDLGASYGLSGHTEISHDNLQNIIKGAQQGNKGTDEISHV
jgi:TolB-like protein